MTPAAFILVLTASLALLVSTGALRRVAAAVVAFRAWLRAADGMLW